MTGKLPIQYQIKTKDGVVVGTLTIHLDRRDLADDLIHTCFYGDPKEEPTKYLAEKIEEDFSNREFSYAFTEETINSLSEFVEDVLMNDFHEPEPQQVRFQDRFITVYN